MSEHLAAVAGDVHRIEAQIAAAVTIGDRVRLELLRTMRIYLTSGLFDTDFYRRANPDLRQPDIDPLEHFVKHGEKEGRVPNPVFWPAYSWDDIVLLAVRPPCEFEASGRSDQLALMRVKRMLTSRLGRDEAFDCYHLMLGLSTGALIRLKHIDSLRAVARARHGAFFEAAPGGEPFRVVPPGVLGEGNQHELDGIARSIFVACLTDARVRGRSAVIETDEVALLDYQEFETAWTEDQLDFDPSVFQAADDAAWIIAVGDDDGVLELDEAFSLLGPRTDGFGYWLWEYLPKYVAAVHAHALPPVPILIDADMPRAHREALGLMLPNGVRLIELPAFAPARVRRLWCAPSQMYMPILRERSRRFRWDCLAAPPKRYAAIAGEMVRRLDCAALPVDGTEKLFLARRDFRHRRLFNEQAIEAAAAERGFRVVVPEELDFAAQVRLVQQARVIIGPDGPGLFLAFFARPGTKLCILCHPDTAGLAVLTGPLDEIGLDVTVLTGPYIRIGDEYRDGSVYQIDEERFTSFVEDWCGNIDRGLSGSTSHRRRTAAKKQNAPRVAAYVGVKDEVEIVERIIDHHRTVGFDLIVFCDANSTDGTVEILERYRSDGDIRIMQIQDPDHPDYYFPAALEIMKREEINWVVNLDADEYCIPASGNVKDCAGLAELDLLYIERFNVPLSSSGPLMPDSLVPGRYDELLLLVEPIADFQNYLHRHPDTAWIRGMDAPKAMARPKRARTTGEGGHDIIAADRAPLRWSRPTDLFIAHLPLTTLTRFVRKVDNIRRFLAAHDAAHDNFSIPGTTPHWRRWLAMAEQGLLGHEFERSVFDLSTIAELRATGVIRSAAEIFERGNRQQSVWRQGSKSSVDAARQPSGRRHIGRIFESGHDRRL